MNRVNELKLGIYGRYRGDTFIPWLHGIDNLLIFKEALDEHIRSIYPNINFTMIYDYKEIQFLDLTVYAANGFLKTKFFSKLSDNHEYLDVRSLHQEAVFRSIPRTVANRVKRYCTDDSEFVRAKLEYTNYLLGASSNISSIDNAFQNIQSLSEETLVRKTEKNQVNVANTSSKQKCITSFKPTYHPVISEIHKIIHKNLRSAVDSSEQLKEILPLDTIKLSSRRDRNLKEMLAPSVPYAHRKDKQLNQLGSCSRCGTQRCKIEILAETNKFCSFTIRFKCRIFGPLNCVSVTFT